MASFLCLLDAGELVEEVLVLEDQGLSTWTPSMEVLLATYVHGGGVSEGGLILCGGGGGGGR